MEKQKITTLIDILTELLAVYQKLRDTVKQKQSSLHERNVDKLENLTGQEESLTGQISELNEKRQTLSQEIIDISISDDRPVSLEEVMKYIPESKRKKVDDLRDQLKSIIRDVQRYNQENVILLESRIGVFDRVFEVLEDEQEQDTYDQELEQDDSSQSSGPVFINEAV